ncbi:E3 ubiquitin-protein ligase ZNRF2 [Eupeodes corollae]|uniref:E3 ubiquitin-protein ligase ZNRF2 n=1 Tax=Eupeodes corollae TaxID=290404 RepID=UPI00248FB8BE|nr:E3 ubiquitin-protein ligase ZNRF2 [Eupeodes corollae]
MGAKASTPANSGHQSPRARTFSSSSSTEVTSPPGTGPGFNVLRALPGIQVPQNDRQRARSLSSVPDLHQSGGSGSGSGGVGNNNNNGGNNIHNHHHHHHHHPHLVGHNDRSAIINRGGTSSTAVVVSSGTPNTVGVGGAGDRIIYGGHSILLNGGTTTGGAISLEQVEEAGIVDGIAASMAASSNSAMGRVYTATSLPSHIWSLNGIKCPVCSKFVLPDDIECHLVMCLTKPRLSYNEDVLTDAKGECVICLEELNPGDVIARLPCLCVYHKGCIDRWFEVNRSCPEHPGD